MIVYYAFQKSKNKKKNSVLVAQYEHPSEALIHQTLVEKDAQLAAEFLDLLLRPYALDNESILCYLPYEENNYKTYWGRLEEEEIKCEVTYQNLPGRDDEITITGVYNGRL